MPGYHLHSRVATVILAAKLLERAIEIMAEIMAQGRPPTPAFSAKSQRLPFQRGVLTRRCGRRGLAQGKRPLKNLWKTNSEPGIAEKAIEIASEVLDTDLTEVIETVQASASDAVVTTQGAFTVRSALSVLRQ